MMGNRRLRLKERSGGGCRYCRRETALPFLVEDARSLHEEVFGAYPDLRRKVLDVDLDLVLGRYLSELEVEKPFFPSQQIIYDFLDLLANNALHRWCSYGPISVRIMPRGFVRFLFLARQGICQHLLTDHALRHEDISEGVTDTVTRGLDHLAVFKNNHPGSFAASYNQGSGFLLRLMIWKISGSARSSSLPTRLMNSP